MSTSTYNRIVTSYYETPVGELMLGSYQEMLCLCDWRHRSMRNEIDSRIKTALSAEFSPGRTDVIRRAEMQLTDYFNGKLTGFNLPLLLVGSSFQKEVWSMLQMVPYGETRSYKQLSEMLGNEKAIRAVAAANGANAISLFIPCHRIVGSKGELTGYAGGIAAKRRLLQLEAAGKGIAQLELFD